VEIELLVQLEAVVPGIFLGPFLLAAEAVALQLNIRRHADVREGFGTVWRTSIHPKTLKKMSVIVHNIFNIGPDKYNGRVVADVATRTTPNVSTALIAAGHGRPYGGGRRAGWCLNQ
jgi:hypothetical protein